MYAALDISGSLYVYDRLPEYMENNLFFPQPGGKMQQVYLFPESVRVTEEDSKNSLTIL
jgi:hypothetical protein